MSQIAFLDDDHVIKLARYLLREPDPQQRDWLLGFFAPEPVDLAGLLAIGAGLKPADGVQAGLADGTGTDLLRSASVIVFRRGQVDRALIDRCPSLRLIQRLGAGSEGIDLQAAREHGVQVSCLPRRSLVRTAEHAFLLMLALAKKLVVADALVRAGSGPNNVGMHGQVAYNWAGLSDIGGLEGRTLGIVGLGEVGKLVAQRAKAFGMRVLYTKRRRLPPQRERELQVNWRPRQELLAESDFVSLHVPDTAENERLLDGEAFAGMRPGAFVVNTSRGRLVDEDALYDALVQGRLAGAGLDVHAHEPRPADRFCALPNVVLTPHVGGGSRLAVLEEIEAIFTNIRAALQGQPVPHARWDGEPLEGEGG